MILVNLSGGLGNQMFQYAAARSLSVSRRTELYIDATGYEQDTPGITKRKYELDLFHITAPLATKDQINKHTERNLLSRAFNKLQPYYKKRHYFERHFHFDANFFKASSSTTLIGYWQSEKYFVGIEDDIRKEFSIKAPLSQKTLALADRMRNSNSASIHIRRGDYVADPATAKAHGSCGLDYYENALRIISEKAGNTELFIFSDDIEWASRNLKTELPITFVDHNKGAQAYEDLYLMSQCSNNIIANSSFSWWAAWLNRNKDKTVVAPQKWFNEYVADTKDLYPPAWIRI
jgi:hypothetical protein